MAVINTNTKALFSQHALKVSGKLQAKSMEQLSTGKRINTAGDDAAGLAISTRMTQQIRALNQAVRNAGDAISLIQTAEGATGEMTNMLQRMREPSSETACGEHHQCWCRRQCVRMADRGEHEVDVGMLAADIFGGGDERVEFAHRGFAGMACAQTREQFGGARVAVRIQRVAEAGQVVAALQTLFDEISRRCGRAGVGDEGIGTRGGAAVARAGPAPTPTRS